MKIAVLHWHTSSVGGINTTLENFRSVAEDRGDTFHVLASDNQRTKKPHLLPVRKRVRGGDSFIMIDGYAPHHVTNWEDSCAFLKKNYDVIMTSFLCPHPTKAYGDRMEFMPLLSDLAAGKNKKPLIGYIHDAYWDTYAEWGLETAKLCSKIVVCQKAYADPLPLTLKKKVVVAYPPFYPIKIKARSRDKNKVLWIPQWKNIKGVRKFFNGIPKLVKEGYGVDMYNNGIEYYKMRLEPQWKEVVCNDFFAEQYEGNGKSVRFFGCVPLTEVFEAIAEAQFVCDFQGHSAKHKAYLNGSYNHTLAETLYYGAVPVVHANILKSGVPKELIIPVEKLEDYPHAIMEHYENPKRARRAKEYVEDTFSAEALYGKIFGN